MKIKIDLLRSEVFALILIALLAIPVSAGAQNIGIAFSQTSGTVTVFDDTGVRGSLALGGFPIGDCAITPDGSTALISDFATGTVDVVDISDPANPALAAGTNPIVTQSRGEDISLSPNGQFAAVCGVGGFGLSIIDVPNRVEVDYFPMPDFDGCRAVEICDDGTSVLLGDGNAGGGRVRRLTMDGSGQLTDTGEVLNIGDQMVNLACAPGSQSGAAVTAFLGGAPGTNGHTFTIPGLAPAGSNPVAVTDAGQSVRFNPAGDRIFFRSVFSPPMVVDAYDYNSATGVVGALQYSIPAPFNDSWIAIETFEVNPDGNTLTLANDIADQIETYNTSDGSVSASPAAFAVPLGPTAVCFGGAPDADGDGVVDGDDLCPNTTIPEATVPSSGSLGNNRYALTDGDGIFDTVTPGNKTAENYTINDTAGCSCEQIIDELGLGGGHVVNGCSNSVMEIFVNLVNQ